MPQKDDRDSSPEDACEGPKTDREKSQNWEDIEGSTGAWSDHEPGTIDSDDAGTDMPWPRE